MGEVRVDERGDGVLLATLSNPPHALMDERIVDGLERLAIRATDDPGVTAVVLTGDHPERFIAHYDIGEILEAGQAAPSVGRNAARASLATAAALRRVPGAAGALAKTPAAGLVAVERFGDVFLRMNRAGAVFVVALNGSAMGGGCELSLACDMRLMAEGDHAIGQPEILFGFPPGGGGTQRLARLLGSAAALRLCLDGGPLTPQEARDLGIVDELVAPDQLLDRALELARRLGSRPKTAIAGVKRAVYLGGALPLPAGLRLERAEFLAAAGTPEAEAAMVAYLDELERDGELPGYIPGRIEKALEEGRFA
jgi:enoyl-CoA hydratase/carnithine racemase